VELDIHFVCNDNCNSPLLKINASDLLLTFSLQDRPTTVVVVQDDEKVTEMQHY
jgi:hypothetical protein